MSATPVSEDVIRELRQMNHKMRRPNITDNSTLTRNTVLTEKFEMKKDFYYEKILFGLFFIFLALRYD